MKDLTLESLVYSGATVLASLVQKMPNAGEHHAHAALIGGGDGFLASSHLQEDK